MKTFKYYPIALTLALSLSVAHLVVAQTDKIAQELFESASQKLKALKMISYQSSLEVHNPENNYFDKFSGESYVEFSSNTKAQVNRVKLYSENYDQVFNGTESFVLYSKDKTYTLKKATIADLNNSILVINNILTLRIALPTIAKDDHITKRAKDTLIDNRTYYLLQFELSNQTLDLSGNGLKRYDDTSSPIKKIYDLVLNRETMLPYMVIERNNRSKSYYHKTVVTNINTNPEIQKEESWYLSSYSDYLPKKKAMENPRVEIGTNIKDWILPVYPDLSRDSIGNADLRGKIVVMEFWQKNCGYCMAAFPELKALQEKFGKINVNVQILSINAYDKLDDIGFFYKRENPEYQMLYNGEALANDLGFYAYPGTVIVDGRGKVIYSGRGFIREEVEKILEMAVIN